MPLSFSPLPPDRPFALAIHTSSPDLGLAIAQFPTSLRSQTWHLGRDLSAQLHPYLADFLHPHTWTDLAYIAVAKGPGSFTGTRMGVVTARTLAQQLDIPLFGISTLAAIAWHQIKQTPEQTPEHTQVAVQLRAQRGEVYGGLYAIAPNGFDGLITEQSDRVMPEAEWANIIAAHPEYQLAIAPENLGETTASLLELAQSQWQQQQRPHWSEVLPFYGQSPV
jgi:tRNA threonylcarbamoyl adenosine modification protein YeaZ